MVPHHSHFWTQTYAQGREQPNFARWPNQARKTLTESTIQGIKGPTKKLATANRSRVSIRVINIFDLQACRRRGQQKISSHHHHHHEKSGYCGSTIRCYLWVYEGISCRAGSGNVGTASGLSIGITSRNQQRFPVYAKPSSGWSGYFYFRQHFYIRYWNFPVGNLFPGLRRNFGFPVRVTKGPLVEVVSARLTSP